MAPRAKKVVEEVVEAVASAVEFVEQEVKLAEPLVEEVIKLVHPDGIETRYEAIGSFMIPILEDVLGWKRG